MGTNHVIPQNIGDSIRGEKKANPLDTDKEFGTDPDETLRMLDDLMADLYNDMVNNPDKWKDSDKEDLKEIEDFHNDYKKIVIRNKEGVIDWKGETKDFLVSSKKKIIPGYWNKNYLVRDGIGKRNPKIGKAVSKGIVYVDLSGSAIEYSGYMLGEIGYMCETLKISKLDVITFSDRIIDIYEDVDSTNAWDKLSNVKEVSGGTNIQQVYADIETNYCNNGKLNNDIEFVMIFTDLEGILGYNKQIEGSANIRNYKDSFSDDTFRKMMYIIFDYTRSYYNGEIINDFDGFLSHNSKKLMIGSDIINKFKNMRMSESVNNKKLKYLYEDSLDDRRRAREARRAARSADSGEREVQQRQAVIRGARLMGNDNDAIYTQRIRDVFGEFNDIATFEKVNDITLARRYNTAAYYITDDMNVYICIDIDKFNYYRFNELCNELKNVDCVVERLYGDVTLKFDFKFVKFGENFPKHVIGKLTLEILRNMTSFENAPTHVSEADIDVNKNVTRQQDIYVDMLKRNGATVMSLSGIRESKSILAEVGHRKMLAESYINEAIAGGVGKMLLPSYRNIGKASSDKAYVLDTTRQHNKKIFDTILTKDYAIDWGNLSDKDFNIVDDSQKVRSIIETVLKDSAPEHIKKYNKIVKSILSTSDPKAKDEKISNEIGSNYFNNTLYNFYKDRGKKDYESGFKQGIRIFTDNDNKITMIILLDREKNNKKRNYEIVCLSHNGEIITDIEKLESFIEKRRSTYLNHIAKDMEYFHMEQSNVPAVNTPLSYLMCRILSMYVAKCMGAKYDKLNWDAYKYTEPDVDILSDEITQGEDQNIDWAYRILASVWGTSEYSVSGMHYTGTSLRHSPMGKTDVKYFYQTPTLRAFHDSVKDKSVLPSLFNDRFLKMLVHSLDVYDTDVIETMHRDDLIDILNKVLDIKLQDTLLCKLMGIEALKDNHQFSAITLFADKAYKMIDLVLPYEMVKEKTNEIKLYRDMFVKNIAGDRVNTQSSVISTYSSKEMMNFLTKNRDQIDNISKLTGIDDPVDSINMFVTEFAPEFMKDIKATMEYIDEQITNPSKQKKLKTVTYQLGTQQDKFFENLEMVRSLYTAIINTCDEYLSSKSDVDIVRADMGYLLEWTSNSISDIKKNLTNIVNDKNVFSSHYNIENLVETAVSTYTNKFMKNIGNAENVISAIKNRRHKYTPASRRVRRDNKHTIGTQKQTSVVATVDFDDVYGEFDAVLSDFRDVIDSVDVNNLSVKPQAKRIFTATIVSGLDDYINEINDAINTAEKINNDVYSKSVEDIVKSIIECMKSVVTNKHDDDTVVTLCVSGTQSLIALFNELESLQVPQSGSKQQIA